MGLLRRIAVKFARWCPSPKCRRFPFAGPEGCNGCKLNLQKECSFPIWIVSQLDKTGKAGIKAEVSLKVKKPISEVSDEDMLEYLPERAFVEGVKKRRSYIKSETAAVRVLRDRKRRGVRHTVWAMIDQLGKKFRAFADWIENTLAEFLNLIFNVWTAGCILVAALFGVKALYEGDWIISLCSVPLIIALGWVNSKAGEETPKEE